MGLNRFPWWKNAIIIAVVLLGFLYALPNLYGEDPAIQISGVGAVEADQTLEDKIDTLLAQANISVKAVHLEDHRLLYRFALPDAQMHAKEIIDKALSTDYIAALNLAPAAPEWMAKIGAHPMKLGLDLRGGVHFLLEVDMQAALQRRLEGYVNQLRVSLREQNILYNSIDLASDGKLYLRFPAIEARDQAFGFIARQVPELTLQKQGDVTLVGDLSLQEQNTVRDYAIEQTMTTLRNRVNELGVAESVVQRQGMNRIVVELPGIQDTARAKEILGKVATIEFRLADPAQSSTTGLVERAPVGYVAYKDREGRTVFLQKRIILNGDQIVGAQSDFDQYGQPAVSIRIRGNIGLFTQVTRENVGKPMATVYIETRFEERDVNGEKIRVPVRKEEVISVARINQALGSSFQISGLNQDEARNLALLLRAGALPADIDIVEERTIGPSLGAENIKMGLRSMEVGLVLVLVFMLMYYRGCGFIANIGLVCNLVLLVAVLSLINATLTLPGIAGIVLTLGMAVDANVLIYERIREELRSGSSIQHSIHAGFEKAFSTILDSNLTTMIAGVVLFSIGSGPIKGFAVTLIMGLLTSVFTAVTVSRAMVNAVYGGRQVKRISIGI